MTQTSKKTIIIIAAIAIVALIVYFAFFRKAAAGTAEGYIDRLNVDRSTKKAIKSYLAKAEAEQNIKQNALDNGINYQQALALSAAYYLVNNKTVPEATWREWVNQVKAM